MSDKQVIRFAPSPNGFLHLGHAYSALLNWDLARENNARFLLRLEDIDIGRSRPEFEQAIYEDLTWLGITWEQPVRRQSEHFSDYEAALDHLYALGVLYPCFCTRKDILAEIARGDSASHGPLGKLYPGTCRNLLEPERERRITNGDAYAVRLDAEAALSVAANLGRLPLAWREISQDAEVDVFCDLSELGDVVIARKDAPTSYHLAVTWDDHLQGITRIVRGKDLFLATHVHRLLQALLGLDTPLYEHHKLIEGPEGDKLSKRKGAPSLKSLREEGAAPEDIRQMVGLPTQS